MNTVNTAKQIIERIEQCNDVDELTSPCLSTCRGIICVDCPVVRPSHCMRPLLMLMDARRVILARGI